MAGGGGAAVDDCFDQVLMRNSLDAFVRLRKRLRRAQGAAAIEFTRRVDPLAASLARRAAR